MFKKKKNNQVQDLTVCEGIKIGSTIYSVEANRLWIFVFKGIMIYLLSAGGICGLLSASGTKHSPILINIVLLITALYLSCIHYSKKSEDIGNSIFLIIIVVFGFGLSLYMNTGFYAVLNDINEKAKIYFDYTGIRTYAEPINNRVLAVNIAAIAIGILFNFLFNMWVTRMMYMDAFLMVMIMLIYPSYVECEPDLIYVIMVICASAMAYILRKSQHYEKTQQDSVYKVEELDSKKKSFKEKIFGKKNVTKQKISIRNILFKKNKKQEITNKKITYRYDIKAYSSVGVQLVVIVFVLVLFMQLFVPKKTYYEKDFDTKLKSDSKEKVGLFVRQGLAGFFSLYDNIAGMGEGRVGGVGIVNLDYNTDFILRFTPYSEDTLYLKQNSYVDYFPYENRWLGLEDCVDTYDVIDYISADENEATTLKKAYENETESLNNSKVSEEEKDLEKNKSSEKAKDLEEDNKKGKKSKKNKNRKTARGKLQLENVGLIDVRFKPYYALNRDMKRSEEKNKSVMDIVYYPRLDETDVKVKQVINLTPYLRYSADNEKTIEKLVKASGIKEGMEIEQVVGRLAAYFQKEFPYTLNPGITPFDEDFVNYFVNVHQKGYCVHFATTATLVFRYMGIPARYVEGYAVKFDDVLSGTALQDKEYKDYYDGYSELGETGYIEVDVTDASAHAWVEIYNEDYGWIPVEVTPASSNESGGSGGFWNRFMGLFSNNSTEDDTLDSKTSIDSAKKKEDFLASDLVRGIVLVVIIVLVIILTLLGSKVWVYNRKYRNANINDKLILDYSRLLRKRCRKYRVLREKVNYEEQLDFMFKQHLFRMSVDENVVTSLVDILNCAGFSAELISKEDDRFVRDILGLL